MSSTSLVVLAGRAAELIGPLPCRAENSQLWFSDLPAELDQAKAFCGPCPLRGPCLAGAIERAEPHGVWGGEIFENGTLTPCKRARGRPRKRPKVLADGPVAAHHPVARHHDRKRSTAMPSAAPGHNAG